MSVSNLDPLVDKIENRANLSLEDRAAILALPHILRTYEPSAYIVREGAAPRHYCDFIKEGFAYRQKLTHNGGRQIVSVHLRGEFLDLQHLFLNVADHNVQALTKLEVIEVERSALLRLIVDYPAIGTAMWIDTQVDSSIYREWLINLGRRDARARIAHIICEVWLRAKAAGYAQDGQFRLPLTQEQLADAVGLTTVHVNRTLMSLRAQGLIDKDKRSISSENLEGLAIAGGFNPAYLHINQPLPKVNARFLPGCPKPDITGIRAF